MTPRPSRAEVERERREDVVRELVERISAFPGALTDAHSFGDWPRAEGLHRAFAADVESLARLATLRRALDGAAPETGEPVEAPEPFTGVQTFKQSALVRWFAGATPEDRLACITEDPSVLDVLIAAVTPPSSPEARRMALEALIERVLIEADSWPSNEAATRIRRIIRDDMRALAARAAQEGGA
jgi:hypothetical protein